MKFIKERGDKVEQSIHRNQSLLFNNDIVDQPLRYSVNDRIIFLLYTLYFILCPFYFWNSGLPQIADFTMMILFFSLLIFHQGYYQIINKKILFIGLLFVTYTVLEYI